MDRQRVEKKKKGEGGESVELVKLRTRKSWERGRPKEKQIIRKRMGLICTGV